MRIKSPFAFWLSLAFLPAIAAANGPVGSAVQGTLFSPGGATVTSSSVTFKVEVWDKAGTCMLYQETHTNVDLSQTNGDFSLELGAGTTRLNKIDTTNALKDNVFRNDVALGPFTDCPGGLTFGNGDARLVRVSFDLGSGWVALTPDMKLMSSPYASVASTLNGKSDTDFVLLRDDAGYDLNQAHLEFAFSSTNYPRLEALLNGTSTQYLTANPTSSVAFNGQRLTNIAAPAASTDAASKGYADSYIGGRATDFTGIGPMIGDGKTLIWDANAGQWTTGSPSSTDNTKLPLAGGTMSGPLSMGGYDFYASGNINIAPFRSLQLGTYTDATEPALVAGDKGKIWYNTDRNAVRFWNGTSVLTQAYLDGTGKLDPNWLPNLPAVDGGALTNVNATRLQGRSVANIAPSSGEVLKWNGSGWAPAMDAGITDLTGDIVASGSGSVAVTISNNAITSAKINNTGNAINRLLITDGSTGGNITYATCALDEVMKWTALGWTCASVSSLSAVTSVAGKTGNVSLNINDIDGWGTATLRNVGTTAGDLIELDASLRLPAVDGGLLTNLSAQRLSGRTLANAAPSTGQFLGWNGSQWEPTSAATTFPLIGSSGTSSAPTYSFSGDTGTGWFSPGAGTLAASTSQTERVRIDSIGNVGVGTTNPGQKLSVNGTIEAMAGGFKFPDGTLQASSATVDISAGTYAGRWILYNATYDGANFNRIDTSQVAYALWFAKLIPFEASTGGIMRVAAAPCANPINVTFATVCGWELLDVATQSGDLVIKGYGIEVDGNGTTPYGRVFHTTYSSSVYSGLGTNLFLDFGGTDSAASPSWFFGQIDDSFSVARSPAGSGAASLTKLLSISASGNVGIGTTTPRGVLDIAATGSTSAIILPRDTTANRPAAGYQVNGMIRYNTDNNKFEAYENGAWANVINSGTIFPLAGSAGSTAAPTYSFSGDTDTGWFSPGAGSLAASTDQTERVRIDANGNVGIGTTNPGSTLHVFGGSSGGTTASGQFTLESSAGVYLQFLNPSTQTSQIRFGNEVTNGAGLVSYAHSTNSMRLYTNASQRMMIDSSGNVGIGTTTPRAVLDVASTGTMSAMIVPRDTTANRPAAGYQVNGMIRYNTDNNKFEAYEAGGWTNLIGSTTFPLAGSAGSASAPTYSFSGDTDTGWYSPGAGILAASMNQTERVRIDADGNMGIGTTSPSSPLHVYGTAGSNLSTVQDSSSHYQYMTGRALTHYFSTEANPRSIVGYSATGNPVDGIVFNQSPTGTAAQNGVGIDSPIFRQMAFYTSNGTALTERMRIDASGNVGIGTTSPAASLELAGTTGNRDLLIGNTMSITPDVTAGSRQGAYIGFNSYVNGGSWNTIDTALGGWAFQPFAGSDAMSAIQFRYRGAGTAANTSPSVVFKLGGDGGLSLGSYAPGSFAPSGGLIVPGNVGIGTTTPGYKLDVAGTIRSSSGGFVFPDGSTQASASGCTPVNSGGASVCLGAASLGGGGTGGQATAIGYNSMNGGSMSGTQVTALGAYTMQFNTSGSYNAGLGSYALQNNTTGSQNVAVGDQSGHYNTTGNYNVFVGQGAGNNASLTSGSNNVFVGQGAGASQTDGSNNILIGQNAQAPSATGSNQLNIGGWIYGASGNVGIGATVPAAKLHVLGGATAFEGTSNNASGPTFSFWKSRNYTATQDNDELGFISFYGQDGSGLARGAHIGGFQDGTVAAGSVPGRLSFFTTTAGNTDGTERMRITSGGNIGIGTSSPGQMLTVAGTIESTSGGFKFPDGSTQSSAATSGVLLSTITASNTAAFQDTTSISASYRYYDIVFENVVPVSNGVALYLQVYSGGSYQSTNYKGVGFSANQNGSAVTTVTTAIDLSQSTRISNSATDGVTGTVTLFNPGNTSSYKRVVGNLGFYDSTVSNDAIVSSTGSWRGGTGALTGFQIYFSTGNISTGSIRIYGRN